MTTNPKWTPLGPTAEVYLQFFEQMPEAQIARALGVSRQRIHGLEGKYGVCRMAPDGRRNRLPPPVCPQCGGPKVRRASLCQTCFNAAARARWPRLICPVCGKEFVRRPQDVRVEEPACSRSCCAKQWWLGQKGANGAKAPFTLFPGV